MTGARNGTGAVVGIGPGPDDGGIAGTAVLFVGHTAGGGGGGQVSVQIEGNSAYGAEFLLGLGLVAVIHLGSAAVAYLEELVVALLYIEIGIVFENNVLCFGKGFGPGPAQQHEFRLVFHRPGQFDGVFDMGHAGNSPGRKVFSIHNRCIHLVFAVVGENGPSSGIVHGVVFKLYDGGFDGIGGRASLFEHGIAGCQCIHQALFVQLFEFGAHGAFQDGAGSSVYDDAVFVHGVGFRSDEIREIQPAFPVWWVKLTPGKTLSLIPLCLKTGATALNVDQMMNKISKHGFFFVQILLLAGLILFNKQLVAQNSSGVVAAPAKKAPAVQPVVQTVPMTASITQHKNASCWGNCDGSATVTASGGTPPYYYSWLPGVGYNSALISNLCIGAYTVYVADSTTPIAYHDTLYMTIDQPTPLVGSTSYTNVTCTGLANGTATTSLSGGTLPYTYSWTSNPPQLTPNATGLPPAVYYLFATDSNNCPYTDTIQIVQPGGYLVQTPVGCLIQLKAVDSLNKGINSWYWSTNNIQSAVDSIVVTASGLYSVVVIDTSYCFHIDSMTVILPTPPPAATIALVGSAMICSVSPPVQWYLDGVPIAGMTDSLLIPAVDGTYTVRNGSLPCTTMSAPIQMTSAGIYSYGHSSLDLNVYPNPGPGHVQLSYTGPGNPSAVLLSDVTGREVLHLKLPGSNSGIYSAELGAAADGIYLLSVTDDQGMILSQKKFILLK